MSKLVPVSHRVLFRILKKLDFECVRQSGGHAIWEHADGRLTVVPVHGREEIGKGLLSKILDDIKLSVDEFNRLR
jgi:predicted RNA binding protein YcfA (HicA-like mRNA interferase family)